MTPLNQMIELWRGIARLHRSDSVVQAIQRNKISQHCLGVMADTIASLMNCYCLALEEAERTTDAQS